MAEKTFTIKKKYAEQIYRKEKKYEIRPVEKRYVGLKVPMLVGWHWYKQQRLVTRLHAVTQFETIEMCLSTLGVDKVIPGSNMKDALESRLQAIYTCMSL